MKQVAFALLLLASASAEAEWKFVDSNEGGNIYVDFATIRKQGNVAKVWVLVDWTAPRRLENGKQFSSMKVQQEYDCGEKRYRTIFASFHSGSMGTGEVVDFDPGVGQWIPASEGFLKVVCKR